MPSGGRVEVTPTVGCRFGGRASTSYSAFIESVEVSPVLSFGMTLESALGPKATLELPWSHQDTERTLNYGQTFPAGYSERLTHLNVDTSQIGGLWQFGTYGDSFRPYLDVLLGMSILTPAPVFSTLTRFSGSVGSGVKYVQSDKLGLRLGLRVMPIYVNSTSSGYGYCDPWYGCYTYYDSNDIDQFDAYTGLTFRF